MASLTISSPPRRLALAVACVASAMLLLEIVVTRIFSVLFFYHFSFFAVSLVMSGLVLGGMLAARFDPRSEEEGVFEGRLSILSAIFSAGTIAAMLVLSRLPPYAGTPSLPTVALYALVFLPGLVPAGAFLALAFARNKAWIGRLYAWDLIAAALACVAAIALLRTLPGPAVLVCPAFLGAIGAMVVAKKGGHRTLGAVLAIASLGLLAGNVATNNELLALRPGPAKLFERWNEHSRIQSWDNGVGHALIIDRSAATTMRPLPKSTGTPIEGDPSWASGGQYQVYDVARPVDNVAIIGVGGGQDVQAALFHNAKHVDGYELNGILVGLFYEDFKDFNTLASRPDVSLIHSEGRVGIEHSGAHYDVIQASLIDTWAATASGGFVLSENGLYTREGWHTFLTHLSDTGILTMTRWYLPQAPAETDRLVLLAAGALADLGIADPRPNVILLGPPGHSEASGKEDAGATTATILVTKTPFTPEEIARLDAHSAELGTAIILGPGKEARDPVFAQLLDPATRQNAIDTSRFNIAPPDDLKPYFFLQVRPSDLVNLSRSEFGMVTEITFNGVRVMMMLGLCATLLVFVVVLLTIMTKPGKRASSGERRTFRWMSLYFLCIGFGYIMIQLGLHQRLILVLGHPTLAFSVLLFSMLLGTGLGSTFSAKLFPGGQIRHAAAVIVATLAVLWLGLPLFPYLESIGSVVLRTAAVSVLLIVVGGVLGFAFPLGVRAAAPTGESAIQKLWAINGAASIAASVLAAIVGLTMGTGMVLCLGLVSYIVAGFAGIFAEGTVAETERA